MNSILDKVLSSKHAEEIAQFVPQEIITRLFAPLPSRERDILIRRFALSGKSQETLEEIGTSLEVTRERVRQIEQNAIKKVRELPSSANILATVEHVVRQYLEESGGALPEDELLRRLIATRDRPEEARSIVRFLLHELCQDRFQYFSPDEHLREGWGVRLFSREQLLQRITTIEEILNREKILLDFSAIERLYHGETKTTDVNDEMLQATLGLAHTIEQNVFGEWGLHSWSTVHPKRMKDKIYLILKRHGKPLHFQAITEMINDAHFDQKIAHPPTVHNELIMDTRFVLVGRGMYALAEWGYKPGVVADVVVDILQKEAAPLSREAIVERVLKQRFVGKATVHLALMQKDRFTKLPDGKYTLVQGG